MGNESEAGFLFDKTYECTVCRHKFTERKIMTGKARLVSQDKDLRPVHYGIDTGKYDIVSCPQCGYTALERYFPNIAASQVKLIRENITGNFKKFNRGSRIVTYDEAIERYKLALANCIVKKSKDSEKALVCLKMAWVLRGCAQNLDMNSPDYCEMYEELMTDESELLHNALQGFVSARYTENFPIAGMDTVQLDYLLAVLSLEEERLDEAGRYIMSVLQSKNATSRIKDRALDIKAEILGKIKGEA